MSFEHFVDESRPRFDMKRTNSEAHESHIKSLTKATVNKQSYPTSGTESEKPRVCSCSCSTDVGKQLQELSERLEVIENKIGGDVEAIFDVLKTFREALKEKGHDVSNTVV